MIYNLLLNFKMRAKINKIGVDLPRGILPMFIALICFYINNSYCLSHEMHRMLADDDKP